MDLRQLEIIRAIVETGSFTGAGLRLQVSQSAISRQILALEAELEQAVFLRVGRRVRLTAAGEALLHLSHRVFRDLEDTVDRISDGARPLAGSLQLAGGMTVCLYVFPPLLREFRRQHPDVDTKITAGTTDKCTALIQGGLADLGLMTLPVDVPELVTTPAFDEEMLLVTTPRHPLARKRRVMPQDLRGESFVLFEAGSNSRRAIDELFRKEQLEPRIVTDTENVELLKNLARAGLGVTIVPYQAVAREAAAGQLFCARIEGHTLVRRLGWVHARTSRVPRTIEEMLRAFDRIKPKLRLAPPLRRTGAGPV
jgi:DNA-binding transcriptional LysR family regulator